MKVNGRVLKDSLELRHSDDSGYNIRTKCRVSAGSVILEEKLLAAAIAPGAAQKQCRYCLSMISPKVLEAPIYCSRCGHAHYCTHRCMKDDVEAHAQSGECTLLQSEARREELGSLLRETCLALRLLQKKPPQPALLSNWAKFLDPASRNDAGVLLLAARAAADARNCAAAGGVAGAQELSEKAAAEAVCQVFTNSLEYEPLLPVASACAGSAAHQGAWHAGEPPAVMYQLASRFNHSCRANAAYHFKPGGTIVVRTLVDVETDQEICVSYLDPLQAFPARAAQLREKFCFTCACERCCEESPACRPGTPGEGGPAHPPSPRAWFLSAMAPTGLPDEAPAEDVRKGMAPIRDGLAELTEQAQELFLRDGRAAQAWAILEAGLFQVVRMGAHPLHQRCLELYSCLASACRVCARRGAGVAALRRAALYGLLQAAAVEAMLAVGEHGAMPQAARIWAETGALLCEVLAAELHDIRQDPIQTDPSAISCLGLHGNQQLSQESSEPSMLEQGVYSNTILDSSMHSEGPATVQLQPQECSLVAHAASHSPNSGADPVAAVNGCSHGQDSHHIAAQHASRAGARQLQQQRGLSAWAQVLPSDGELAAHASIPEPPAEFAAVLCATWRALLPTALAPGGGSEQSMPAMPCLAQPDGANSSLDNHACPLPGSNGQPGKRQRTAAEASEGAAHSAPAAEEDPATASALGGGAAGVHQQDGLEGQGLDFRLLGEPAGLTSSHAQPSSKATLAAALTSEPGLSGIGGEQLERLEHIAHGAAMCQAHAASLLQIVLGRSHTLTQSSAFSAFFANLPYRQAAAITQLASQLSMEGSL